MRQKCRHFVGRDTLELFGPGVVIVQCQAKIFGVDRFSFLIF